MSNSRVNYRRSFKPSRLVDLKSRTVYSRVSRKLLLFSVSVFLWVCVCVCVSVTLSVLLIAHYYPGFRSFGSWASAEWPRLLRRQNDVGVYNVPDHSRGALSSSAAVRLKIKPITRADVKAAILSLGRRPTTTKDRLSPWRATRRRPAPAKMHDRLSWSAIRTNERPENNWRGVASQTTGYQFGPLSFRSYVDIYRSGTDNLSPPPVRATRYPKASPSAAADWVFFSTAAHCCPASLKCRDEDKEIAASRGENVNHVAALLC